MEKYTRIAIEVDAIQWFPRKELPINGFKNIIIKFLDQGGQPREAVEQAEIIQVIGDKEYKLTLNPADWVLLTPSGGLIVVKDDDFVNSYFQTSQLQQIIDHGTPEQKAMFGIIPVPTPPISS